MSERPRVVIVGGGLGAWLFRALVHTVPLELSQNRLLVFAHWAWTDLTRQRGSRRILGRP